MRRRGKAGVRNVGYFRHAGRQYVVLGVPLPAGLPAKLTQAEQHVVPLILDGKSNAAIAKARGVAVRTIANQIASIMKKLGVGSRAELIALLSDGK